ncbi:hypothetical protein [Arthrobacter sp. 4R501]|uniref:hypothetical protein n=1 Tax=Arthrobacter sp. 4R501 TaxID=2058886 RepID=UPI0011B06DA4|nr:hypothetical protein [Arthrobacter sp. 4R501]
MTDLKTMYIVVGDNKNQRYSYVWRIWWHGSSFYIKARDEALAHFKVSFHGADAFHPKPGYIVGRDQSALGAAKSRTVESGRFLGSRFPGREVSDGALHVATFRFGAELFADGVNATPLPDDVKLHPSIAARIAVTPAAGEVTDVHLYWAKGRPYVQHEEKARKADAILGPLRNDQNEYLTGLVNKCSLAKNLSPDGLMGPPPSDEKDRVRGFGGIIDPDGGFLWIAEQWLSRKHLEASGP